MSRLHLLIGAAVILILGLVFFGNNPMDEMRKRREMKKTKTLVEKIVQNANKKDIAKQLLGKKPPPTGITYGMDTSSDIEPMEPGPGGRAGGQVTSRSAINKGMTSGGAPGATGGTTRLKNPYLDSSNPVNAAPAQAAPAPSETYYPPPALKRGGREKPTSSLKKEDIFDPGFGVHLNMPLNRQGEQARRVSRKGNQETKNVYVAFEGTRAFMKDEEGNVLPVPDGEYQMPGSKRKVVIQAGKKVMPN